MVLLNEEVGYYSKRGRDWINRLSMTLHQRLSELMFVLILRQNLKRFANFFLSVIDCLITPKREDQVMGGLDVETFLLLVSVVLERADDELELKLVVVVPVRLDFETKSETFCEIFLSVIDCLITPKREDRVMGGLDVETFLLLVSVVLERADDELELKLVVVVPLRTMVVGATEGL